MFDKVLVAMRGEIAVRVIRTLRRMGIASVAVWADADRFTLPVRLADEAVRLGPRLAVVSYLDFDAVIAACKATGAQAVHPGHGFLSENIGFAGRLAVEGIAFIGPRPEHLPAFGLKHTARAGAGGGRAAAAGIGPAGRPGDGPGRGRADRLSGDAEKHGGRRRHRHAALRRQGHPALRF